MEPPARRRAFDLEILETEYSVRYLKKKKKKEREKKKIGLVFHNTERTENALLCILSMQEANCLFVTKLEARTTVDSRTFVLLTPSDTLIVSYRRRV